MKFKFQRTLGYKVTPGVLVTVLLIGAVNAVANPAIRTFLTPSQSLLLTAPRDPEGFLSDFALVVPDAPILLSREDVIAQELVMRARGLTHEKALQTAHVLCEESRRFGYDPLFFLAVIEIESVFNHLAVSHVGAEGLMQLMPKTARWMATRYELSWADGQTFDPAANVRLGIRYLHLLHRQFRHIDVALTAYNRGPATTQAILRNSGMVPTAIDAQYAGKIQARYQRLLRDFGHLPLAHAS